MTRTPTLRCFVWILPALLPFVTAAEELIDPTKIPVERGFFTVPLSSDSPGLAVPQQGRIGAYGPTRSGMVDIEPAPDRGIPFIPLALGPGAFPRLAMMSSWVTSDIAGEPFETALMWPDDEELSVVALFFTNKTRSVEARVTVKDAGGALVFDDTLVDDPEPGSINGVVVPVGSLSQGAYRVKVRVNQGKKGVGAAYFIAVVDSETFVERLEIAGDYQLDRRTEQTEDTCKLPFSFEVLFFGSGDSFEVDDVNGLPLSAVVDFGAFLPPNFCDPNVYSRAGNTLTFTEELDVPLPLCGGSCMLRDERTITLEFFDDGSVRAEGVARFTAKEGDCGCVELPCFKQATIVGNTCKDCFDCISFGGN